MRLPRIPRSSRSWIVSRFVSPRKRMRPATSAPSSKRSTDSAVTDLPEPDSPTSATVLPAGTSIETSSTTFTPPNDTDSPSIDKSGDDDDVIASLLLALLLGGLLRSEEHTSELQSRVDIS